MSSRPFGPLSRGLALSTVYSQMAEAHAQKAPSRFPAQARKVALLEATKAASSERRIKQESGRSVGEEGVWFGFGWWASWHGSGGGLSSRRI